jgi:hypothetical protein
MISVRGVLKIFTHPDETKALTPACFVASKTISKKIELFHVYRGRKEDGITREGSRIIYDNRTKSENSLMVKKQHRKKIIGKNAPNIHWGFASRQKSDQLRRRLICRS